MSKTLAPKRILTIGLLWHSYFSGNLGVSALSIGNMTIIRDAAREHGIACKFILFGPRGDYAFPQPDGFGDIDYVEASSFSKMSSLRSRLSACDLVFDIGSGDSFADIYGLRRFAKIAGLKFLVPNSRNRLVISPQTLGPFANPLLRRVATKAMQRSRLIMARDKPSLERARALVGPTTAKRLHLSTDVAFAMQPLDHWPDSFPDLNSGINHVGLNVSGLLFHGGYSGDNQFGLSVDYADLIRSFIETAKDRTDLQLWLVPHVYSLTGDGMESDLQVARSLAEEYDHVRIAPVFKSAPEAKTFIARMNIVYSARMHAAIAAVSSGVACLPLSYSVKFKGLFAQLGYNHLVDLKAGDTQSALTEMTDALSQVDAMTNDARQASANAVGILDRYRGEVDRLFASFGKSGQA